MDDREAHHVYGTGAWRIWNVGEERYETGVISDAALLTEMRRRGWASLSVIPVVDWAVAGY